MIPDTPQLQAGLLAIVAGLADAVGDVARGGVFAANMTGNTVLAGSSLGDGPFDLDARRPARPVTFFLGAMLARLLLRLFHRPARGRDRPLARVAPCALRPGACDARIVHISIVAACVTTETRKAERSPPSRAYSDASKIDCTVL